jgi:predicted O-methyltransferase YrrM
VTSTQWTAVDDYFAAHFVEPDAILEAALADSQRAGLPQIAVSPNQGNLLQVLAATTGARRILEIGTLGAYSTIWLARALPTGGRPGEEARLITLELDPKHAEVARVNLERAGLADVVEVRVGPALDSLQRLIEESAGPFDLIFIDADKANLAGYFDAALQLSRRGTLIVIDNVVRNGAVVDGSSTDPSVQGVRRFVERAAAESRVMLTAVQTVGSKGYDGFALALVRDDSEQ